MHSEKVASVTPPLLFLIKSSQFHRLIMRLFIYFTLFCLTLGDDKPSAAIRGRVPNDPVPSTRRKTIMSREVGVQKKPKGRWGLGFSTPVKLGLLLLLGIAGHQALHSNPDVKSNVDSIVVGVDRSLSNFPSKTLTSLGNFVDGDRIVGALTDAGKMVGKWFDENFNPVTIGKIRDERFDLTFNEISQNDFDRVFRDVKERFLELKRVRHVRRTYRNSEGRLRETVDTYRPSQEEIDRANTLMGAARDIDKIFSTGKNQGGFIPVTQSENRYAVRAFEEQVNSIHREYYYNSYHGTNRLESLKLILQQESEQSGGAAHIVSSRRNQLKRAILKSMIRTEREKQASARKPWFSSSLENLNRDVVSAISSFVPGKSQGQLARIIRDYASAFLKKPDETGEINKEKKDFEREIFSILKTEFPATHDNAIQNSKSDDLEKLGNIVHLVTKQIAINSGNAPYYLFPAFSAAQQKAHFADLVEVLKSFDDGSLDLETRFEKALRLAIAKVSLDRLSRGIDWTVDQSILSD